jgi:putative glutamine amidotransferase
MGRPRVGLTQRVEDLPDRGERRDALDQAWTPFLARAGLQVVPIPNLVDDPGAFVDDLDLALVVLTGGNDLATAAAAVNPAPERDETERALVEHALARGTPVLGVCRGLQLLVAHLGGPLHRVDGHVGTPHSIEVTGAGTWPIRTGPVSSYHDWGIGSEAVPATFDVLAWAADGTVEAIAHRDRPIVGVMWHPERAPEDGTDLELVRALVEAG